MLQIEEVRHNHHALWQSYGEISFHFFQIQHVIADMKFFLSC